jgi:hypothetical protein
MLTGQGHCEPGISTEKLSCTFCIEFVMNYQPVHVSSITCSSSGGAATRNGVELVSEFHSNPGSSQQT